MATLEIRRILCPVDFGPLSDLALQHAAQLAQRTGAHIAVVHAHRVLPPRYFTVDETGAVAQSLQREEAAARDYLRAYLEPRVPAGVDAEPVVAAADAVEAILSEAQRRHADVIVMGTHGRTGLDRLVIGSVTERVLHEARVPVLAVRQPPAGAAEDAEVRRILLPTNFTAADETALQHAVALGRLFDAELVVAHVTGDGSAASALHDRVCRWVPQPAQARCRVRPVVRQGDPAEQLLSLALEERVDLVVVAGQRRRLLDLEVFGSTTERIVRHAPAPVWVTPVPPP